MYMYTLQLVSLYKQYDTYNAVFKCPSDHFNNCERENGRFLPMPCLIPCNTEAGLILQETFPDSHIQVMSPNLLHLQNKA